jgi:hypothetical protein
MPTYSGWEDQAIRHERRMREILDEGGDMTDPAYRLHETERNACHGAKMYAPIDDDGSDATA